MKQLIKLFTIFLVAAISTACTTTTTLNRGLVQQEKIKTVNLNKLDENMSVEASGALKTGVIAGGVVGALVGGAIDASANAKRKKTLAPLQEKINNIDVNKVLKNALEHHLADGQAFSDDVMVDNEYDQSVKKPFLTPILTPSVIISLDYTELTVSLNSTISQRSLKDTENRHSSTYSSIQTLDLAIVSDKEANIQYWLDNPVVLKEKIVDGLYDVSKQFADDFNADQ